MESRRLAALAVAGLGTVTGIAPASAECLTVTFEVHWWNAPDTYPLGQRDTCVTDTPWNKFHEEHVQEDHYPELVPGMPRGFFLQVWFVGP